MTTTNNEDLLNPLRDLGFSGIEALVYAFLLRQGSAVTGYRVSRGIGKPTANTYQAIAALERQGALVVDDGDSRLVRAVPPDELLAALERRARARWEAARGALAELAGEAVDDRVYALREPGQVLERARALLGRADGIVLGDIFPAPLAALADDLAAAAARGVRVVVKGYAPATVAGVELVLASDASRVGKRWPGQQLSLVADADEHLLALFDAGLGRVHQAVWSRSTFLSCMHHNHVAMELLVTARELDGPSLTPADGRADLIAITLLRSQPRGLLRLRERYGGAPGAAEETP